MEITFKRRELFADWKILISFHVRDRSWPPGGNNITGLEMPGPVQAAVWRHHCNCLQEFDAKMNWQNVLCCRATEAISTCPGVLRVPAHYALTRCLFMLCRFIARWWAPTRGTEASRELTTRAPRQRCTNEATDLNDAANWKSINTYL